MQPAGQSPITVPSILARKGNKKISAITAYDFTFARIIDHAGVDVILVGDSAASVIQGYHTTLPVTLEEMIYHCRCVSHGVSHALVVGDLPFLSYQPSLEVALQSAGRLLKEGGVSAVKLEGGIAASAIIEKLTSFDIPVMGHVGLTPQSYHRMGGHKVQGKISDAKGEMAAGTRKRILADARAVQQAGAFSLVIEGVPSDLAQEITEELIIPTIGIGAGAGCDGQILVCYDLLGLTPDPAPKFVRRFANLSAAVQGAVEEFVEEVQQGSFPSREESFSASPSRGIPISC